MFGEEERVWVLRRVGYGAVTRTWEVFERVTQVKCECERERERERERPPEETDSRRL